MSSAFLRSVKNSHMRPSQNMSPANAVTALNQPERWCSQTCSPSTHIGSASTFIHKHHLKLYIYIWCHAHTCWMPVCPYSTDWRLLQSLEPQSGTVNHTMVSRVTFSFSTTNIYIYVLYTHTHTGCLFFILSVTCLSQRLRHESVSVKISVHQMF